MRFNTPTAPSRAGSTAAPEGRAPRLRALLLPGIVVLAVFVALVALGNWQMQRLQWKDALIASVNERPALPPLEWSDPAVRQLARDPDFAADYSYRALRLEGEYLPEEEVRVFTSLPAESAKGGASGPGYWIMAPFQPDGADAPVWVNRGFAPEGAQWTPPPAGRTTIVGLVRPDDPRQMFTPADRPELNLFFARSVPVLSEAKQLPIDATTQAFTIDLLPVPGAPALPQAGETRMTFTNNHLSYALTWYGLAAALLAVFASFLRTRLREGSQEPPLTRP